MLEYLFRKWRKKRGSVRIFRAKCTESRSTQQYISFSNFLNAPEGRRYQKNCKNITDLKENKTKRRQTKVENMIALWPVEFNFIFR